MHLKCIKAECLEASSDGVLFRAIQILYYKIVAYLDNLFLGFYSCDVVINNKRDIV